MKNEPVKERVCKNCQIKRAKLVWDAAQESDLPTEMKASFINLFRMQLRIMNNDLAPSHFDAYIKEQRLKGLVDA